MPQSVCPHCGSTQIITDLTTGVSHETSRIGLQHRPGHFQILVEPFRADLCSDCGTIVRLWVKEPNLKWHKT